MAVKIHGVLVGRFLFLGLPWFKGNEPPQFSENKVYQ